MHPNRRFDGVVGINGLPEKWHGAERDASTREALVERPHGIVLVTGPTGSGKTTTLYSTLKRLATPDVNV